MRDANTFISEVILETQKPQPWKIWTLLLAD